MINNMEACIPVLPETLKRRLSAAAFFDAGRAFRRFSEVGDFGYGVGVCLRYIVTVWRLRGVARIDYGISLDHEGDDSSARLHFGVGLPF